MNNILLLSFCPLFSNVQFPKLKILDLGCNKIKHVSSSDLEKNCVSKFCSYSDRSRPGKVFLEDEKYFNHWVEMPFETYMYYMYALPAGTTVLSLYFKF